MNGRMIMTQLFVLSCLFVHGSIGWSDDLDVEEAFKNVGNLPWYDSDQNEVIYVDVDENNERANSLDRQQIDEAEVKAPQTQNTPPPTARSTEAAGITGQLFLYLVIALAILVIVGLLVWAFMQMSTREHEEEEEEDNLPELTPEKIAALPADLNVDKNSGDLLSLARNAYQAQDFRNAAIYLYSHALLVLDQQGWVRLAKGKTNRQYLKELTGVFSMTDFFENLMCRFEEAFFGQRNLNQSDLSGTWPRIDQFLQSAKTRKPA